MLKNLNFPMVCRLQITWQNHKTLWVGGSVVQVMLGADWSEVSKGHKSLQVLRKL